MSAKHPPNVFKYKIQKTRKLTILDCKTCILSWHQTLRLIQVTGLCSEVARSIRTPDSTHAQGLWQRRNTRKSNAHQVAAKNLIQYIQLSFRSPREVPLLITDNWSTVTECCSRLFGRSMSMQRWSTSASNPWKPPNLRNETNCYHFTGVIILPTQTMHYTSGNPSKQPYICIVWFPKNG